MPDINDLFPSKYLKGSELRGPVTVTIQRISPESMYKPGSGNTTGYVVYFEKATKGVVLSRPLGLSIAQALGGESNTDKWPGKAITLYPQPMTVAGRDIVAVRARPAQPKPANGTPPGLTPSPADAPPAEQASE